MGSGRVLGSTRYSTPPDPPSSHYPGYTPPPGIVYTVYGYSMPARSKVAVGLISVEQLSLYAHFSGFQGITEGYNLAIAGNPDDHNVIPGTD